MWLLFIAWLLLTFSLPFIRSDLDGDRFFVPFRFVLLFHFFTLAACLWFAVKNHCFKTFAVAVSVICGLLTLIPFLLIFSARESQLNAKEAFVFALVFLGPAFLLGADAFLHFLFVLVFVVVKKLRPLSDASKLLINIAIVYGCVLYALISWNQFSGYRSGEEFCRTANAEALYAQLFFPKPITREKLKSIVISDDLSMNAMLLSSSTSSEFVRPELDPPYSSSTIDRPLRSLLLMSGNEEEAQKETASELFESFERNEPVVRFTEFLPKPMSTVVSLVERLDREGLLGVYEEEPNLISGYPFAGQYPQYIKRPTPTHDIIQSRCYPETLRREFWRALFL